MSPHQAYPLLKHVKRQKKKIPCPYNNGPCSIVSLPSFVLPPPAFPPPLLYGPSLELTMVNWQDPVTIINEFGALCSTSFYVPLSFSLSLIFFFFFWKILAGAFVKLIHVADGIYMYVMLVVASCAINLDNFF